MVQWSHNIKGSFAPIVHGPDSNINQDSKYLHGVLLLNSLVEVVVSAISSQENMRKFNIMYDDLNYEDSRQTGFIRASDQIDNEEDLIFLEECALAVIFGDKDAPLITQMDSASNRKELQFSGDLFFGLFSAVKYSLFGNEAFFGEHFTRLSARIKPSLKSTCYLSEMNPQLREKIYEGTASIDETVSRFEASINKIRDKCGEGDKFLSCLNLVNLEVRGFIGQAYLYEPEGVFELYDGFLSFFESVERLILENRTRGASCIASIGEEISSLAGVASIGASFRADFDPFKGESYINEARIHYAAALGVSDNQSGIAKLFEVVDPLVESYRTLPIELLSIAEMLPLIDGSRLAVIYELKGRWERGLAKIGAKAKNLLGYISLENRWEFLGIFEKVAPVIQKININQIDTRRGIFHLVETLIDPDSGFDISNLEKLISISKLEDDRPINWLISNWDVLSKSTIALDDFINVLDLPWGLEYCRISLKFIESGDLRRGALMLLCATPPRIKGQPSKVEKAIVSFPDIELEDLFATKSKEKFYQKLFPGEKIEFKIESRKIPSSDRQNLDVNLSLLTQNEDIKKIIRIGQIELSGSPTAIRCFEENLEELSTSLTFKLILTNSALFRLYLRALQIDPICTSLAIKESEEKASANPFRTIKRGLESITSSGSYADVGISETFSDEVSDVKFDETRSFRRLCEKPFKRIILFHFGLKDDEAKRLELLGKDRGIEVSVRTSGRRISSSSFKEGDAVIIGTAWLDHSSYYSVKGAINPDTNYLFHYPERSFSSFIRLINEIGRLKDAYNLKI